MTRVRAAAAALLAFTLSGCSAERIPVSPIGPDRPPLLLAFLTDRPPSQSFASDILFFDLRGGGPAYLPENVNTANTEGETFDDEGDGFALSGNGRSLAFLTNRLPIGSTARVFLYDVAGRRLRSPPPNVNRLSLVRHLSLSGDGRYLAVQHQLSVSPADRFVAIEDLAAGALLALPNLNDPDGANADPSLNGDGSLVAFTSDRPGGRGGSDVYLYSVRGDSLIPLPGLNSSAEDFGASLSADGRHLAFQSDRPSGSGLMKVYVYDRATASLAPADGDSLAQVQPAISPDGRYLAYATLSAAGRDVWVYDLRARRKLRLEGLNHPQFLDYAPSLASLPAWR